MTESPSEDCLHDSIPIHLPILSPGSSLQLKPDPQPASTVNRQRLAFTELTKDRRYREGASTVKRLMALEYRHA